MTALQDYIDSINDDRDGFEVTTDAIKWIGARLDELASALGDRHEGCVCRVECAQVGRGEGVISNDDRAQPAGRVHSDDLQGLSTVVRLPNEWDASAFARILAKSLDDSFRGMVDGEHFGGGSGNGYVVDGDGAGHGEGSSQVPGSAAATAGPFDGSLGEEVGGVSSRAPSASHSLRDLGRRLDAEAHDFYGTEPTA